MGRHGSPVGPVMVASQYPMVCPDALRNCDGPWWWKYQRRHTGDTVKPHMFARFVNVASVDTVPSGMRMRAMAVALCT